MYFNFKHKTNKKAKNGKKRLIDILIKVKVY